MIADVDYTDNFAFLVNISAQPESLLQSLEPAARGIDLDVNSVKIEFICFNQDGAISS